jgi:hypothetical protein
MTPSPLENCLTQTILTPTPQLHIAEGRKVGSALLGIGYIPKPCSWWEVLDLQGQPIGEFHVDIANPDGTFHIDQVWPGPIMIPLGLPVVAQKKVDRIAPCDYFVVHWPAHWYPTPCSWWEIIDPETGMTFCRHADDYKREGRRTRPS